jgi:hypothetical protein
MGSVRHIGGTWMTEPASVYAWMTTNAERSELKASTRMTPLCALRSTLFGVSGFLK